MKNLITLITFLSLIRMAASQELPIPHVYMRHLNGELVSSESLLQPGHPTLLVIWNPDIPQSNLEAVYEAWQTGLKAIGCRMVLVPSGYSGPYTSIRPMLDGNGYEFNAVFIDINGEFRRSLGIGPGPCIILVFDENKHFLSRLDGNVQGSAEEIAKSIFNMLGIPVPEQLSAEKPAVEALPRIRDRP